MNNPITLPVTPAPFPEDKAAKILEKAAEYGVAGIEKVIEMARDMFGHDEYVIETANTWGRDATDHIGNSLIGMNEARQSLVSYWEGPAHEAFEIYHRGLKKAADDMPGIFGDIAESIRKSMGLIIDQYNVVVDLIISFSETLEDITTEIISVFDMVDVLDVIPGIVDALQEFRREVKDAVHKTVSIVQEYWANTAKIRDQASQFPQIDKTAPSIGDSNLWNVRNR